MNTSKNHRLLVIHVVATFVMIGVIWLVQLVHYPLMGFVEEARFSEFERSHRERIIWIVAPAMLIEGATGAWLSTSMPNDWRRGLVRFGLVLLGVIWISTLFIQIPLHDALQTNFLASDLDRLVATNWIRTIAWSLRGALCVYLLVSINEKFGLCQPKRNANKN